MSVYVSHDAPLNQTQGNNMPVLHNDEYVSQSLQKIFRNESTINEKHFSVTDRLVIGYGYHMFNLSGTHNLKADATDLRRKTLQIVLYFTSKPRPVSPHPALTFSYFLDRHSILYHSLLPSCTC